MNRQFKHYFILVFLVIFVPHIKTQDIQNPVVIDHAGHNKKSWHVTSEQGYIIRFPKTNKPEEKITDASLVVTTKNGKLFFNGKKMVAEHIVLSPISGELTFLDVHYKESLEIVREKKRIVLRQVYQSHEQALVRDVSTHIDVVTPQAHGEKKNDSDETIKIAPHKSKDFIVRVLLDEIDEVDSVPWKLHSKKGFIIMDPLEPSKKRKTEVQDLVIKTDKSGHISINGKPMYTLQAFITPITDTITFNDKDYRGSVWLLAEGNTNKLINCIGIEDYVATVLSTESWPGWSLEVNKVLAIACRTYVIAMVQNAKTVKRPYHVKNTNKHQTYGGGTVATIHQQAVDQTKGIFLTHEGKPIIAMFDGCCGGVITKHMHGVDFKQAPYLARSYPCTYCKDFKIFSWQAEYDVSELHDIIKPHTRGLRKLRDVKIAKKDKAGVVQHVHFKGMGQQQDLSGKKIYSLLNKKIKSFCYTIEKNGSTVTFKGKGYGHHLGLCQWGAKGMVSQGFNHKAVLEFYYPGTQLMRLI